MSEGIPESSFSQDFLKINKLKNFFGLWEFLPGMKFKENKKWWGQKGDRATPHEGLDLRYYLDKEGNSRQIPIDSSIPPVYRGEIVSRFSDFIGESILVRHFYQNSSGDYLYSVFGHIAAVSGMVPGKVINEKQPFCRMAVSKKPDILPSHIHISLLWIEQTVQVQELDWNSINCSGGITLIDPVALVV